jgi:hypothetical protein
MMISDLEKAYYSVPMHPDSWPFLCFDTPIGLLAGTCLLFGDAQAPFTFHKITRHIVAISGVLGIRVMSYLDDFLWMATPDRIPQTSAFAQWILPLLGWSLNQKCDFTPSTFKKFLGFYVDSAQMRLKAPFRKVREISGMLADAIAGRSCSLEHLQSLTGKIIALKLAIPGTRAWTRSANNLIASTIKGGTTPSQLIPLPDEVLEDFGFLLTHIPDWSTVGLPLPSAAIDISVRTDAGEFGYGGHTDNLRPNVEYAGSLPPEAIGKSSTYREFIGLHGVSNALRRTLRNKRVLFRLTPNVWSATSTKRGGKSLSSTACGRRGSSSAPHTT